MEPNEKEKQTDWKKIKLYIKLMLTFVVIVMTPLLIFNYSRSTYKPIKILIALAGVMIIVFFDNSSSNNPGYKQIRK